jgi:hypothetical protein
VAIEVIDDTVKFKPVTFTEADRDLLARAMRNDKVIGAHGRSQSLLFRRQVAVVPNCAVLGHVGAAIRVTDGALLALHCGEPPNWNRAKPRRLKPRFFDDKLVTWLDGTKHYFHFFASLLPLIGYLDREHHPDRPLTALIPAGGPAYQDQVCAAIAAVYPGLTFEHLQPDERAEIPRYLWLHHGSGNAEWLPASRDEAGRLARLLRRHYGLGEPEGGGRMFLSRGNAKLRRLLNEDALTEIAATEGFARFQAHSGNHAEQVRAFGEADVIVAVHGAGLTNLLFARPGATIVEIFPEDCVKSTYLWLARRLGLNYLPLTGGPGNYKQAFTLAPQIFQSGLEKALLMKPPAAARPASRAGEREAPSLEIAAAPL